MPALINEIGNIYGRLLVLSRIETTGRGIRYECKCECGNIIERNIIELRESKKENRIASCGCYKIEYLNSKESHIYKHGKVNTPEYKIWSKSKERAKQKGWEHNIEIDDIIIPEYCPLLGIKLKRNIYGMDDSPSIDRINPEKGYIKGNIWIISNRANRIKNDSNIQELEMLVINLKKNINYCNT